jgi:uncharacterized repeat protein (TIGR01451 family)
MKKVSFFIFFIASFVFNVQKTKAQLNSDWQRYTNLANPTDFFITDIQGNSYSFIPTGLSVGYDYDPGPGIHEPISGTDFVILKLDSSGNTLWLKDFTLGPGYIQTGLLYPAVDSVGNLYLMSLFHGAFDIDPDTSVYMLTPVLNDNTFIAKFNENGTLVWAKSITHASNSWFKTIGCDNDGNIIVTGSFYTATDIDFNASTSIMSPVGNADVFVAKYNTDGDLIWNFHQGNPSTYLSIESAVIDHDGSIIVCGGGRHSFDFDPGAGIDSVYMPSNHYGRMLFKINNNGGLDWVTELDCASLDITAMCLDPNNNFVIFGMYNDAIAGDHLNPDTLCTTDLANELVYLKYNQLGELLFFKVIKRQELPGASTSQILKDATIDNDGNMVLLIRASRGLDLDTGPGLVLKNFVSTFIPNSTNHYLVCYNSLGNYLWDISDQLKYNGVFATKINFNNTTKSLYINADFGVLDFDTIAPVLINLHGVARYAINVCANLGISIDSINSSSCTSAGFASAIAFGGSSPYNYTWNSLPSIDTSVANLNGGTYHVSVIDSNNCLTGRDVFIDGPDTNSVFDLNVDAFSADFVAGFEQILFLKMNNFSCDSVSGTLNFIKDPLMSILGANPPVSSYSGDTIKWNFNDFSYLNNDFSVALHIRTSSSALIGDTINYQLLALPLIGDNDTINNHKFYSFPVFSSFDPNDKKVSPMGEGIEGFIDTNVVLNYTIRFQNTGNYVATNIVLLDTIDSDLNYLSLHVNSASHLYTVEYLPNNIVKFKFLNIMLPDSTADFEASMGYINFSIEQKANLAPSTEIKNTAYIYFDYNPAVITNTTLNTIYPLLTNTKNNVILNDIAISPNPAHQFINIKGKVIVKEIKVFDISGNLIFSSNAAHENINISELSNGLYFIEIVDSSGNAYRNKFIKN